MPNMNGMEFIKKLKEDPQLSSIPVIMQTAAAEKEQVVQGIRAGVYYYLTKPYDHSVMLSVVRAAANDYTQYSRMRKELRQFKQKLQLVKDSNFEVKTIEDAKYLATFLANFFPDPERVVFGISELLVNGVEHGNLGIGYDEKTRLNNEGRWLEEVTRRLELPEYRDKKIQVSYVRNDDVITLRIKDDGNGFNWMEYLEISPDRAMDNHGRGIAISKMMSFDSLEYNDRGNEVTCTVQLQV